MYKKISLAMLAAVMIAAPLVPLQADAKTMSVSEAQRIMTKFDLPDGPRDGIDGAQTRRGLCTFRFMTRLPMNRAPLDTRTANKLRQYDKKYSNLSQVPARYNSIHNEKIDALETCQSMVYSKENRNGNHYYKRVMAMTSGINSYPTPNGHFVLGNTQRGWHCSTLYPESCYKQSNGRFKNYKTSSYKPVSTGNMYNFRSFKAGGWGVHGSNAISTKPQSHGCVRVSVADSDWMYDNVGNRGITVGFSVKGSY